MPITHKDYVPILKWRQGEYQALWRLGVAQKSHVVPLIEICPPEYDFEAQQPAKSIDDHLLKFGPRLEKKWGPRPAMIDAGLLDPCERMIGGVHPLTRLLDEGRKVGGLLIPVTELDRDVAYQVAVRHASSVDGHGVAIRCGLDEIADQSFEQNTLNLCNYLGIDIDELDIVVDLAEANLQPANGLAKLLATCFASSTLFEEARSFVIAGTAFPSSMTGIVPPIQTVARDEWLLYKALMNELSNQRIPTFGDYAIASPELVQGDMRLWKPSATIRYTVDDAWLIAKGNNVRDNGFQQYRAHSSRVVKSKGYLGSAFSKGSDYINKCAQGAESTGNLTTWRWVGTNHHITKIVSDLAILHGP